MVTKEHGKICLPATQFPRLRPAFCDAVDRRSRWSYPAWLLQRRTSTEFLQSNRGTVLLCGSVVEAGKYWYVALVGRYRNYQRHCRGGLGNWSKNGLRNGSRTISKSRFYGTCKSEESRTLREYVMMSDRVCIWRLVISIVSVETLFLKAYLHPQRFSRCPATLWSPAGHQPGG